MKRQSARTSSVGAAAFLLLAFAGPALSEQPPEPKESSTIVDVWLEQYREAEQLLREGEWKKVRKKLDLQLDVMMRQLHSGEGSAGLLGTGIGLRAIAEAGLGEYDDAAWDWSVAKAFAPQVASVDLKQFGAAGEFFAGEELSSRNPDSALPGQIDPDARFEVAPAENDPTFSPPRKRFAPDPEYPRARAPVCQEGPVLVQVVVDRQGIPRSPRWFQNYDAVLLLSALEALREWRFEPARREGEPVEFHFLLIVKFQYGIDCGSSRR